MNEDYNEDDLGLNPIDEERVFESLRRIGAKPEKMADLAARERYAEYLKKHQSD